MKIKAILILVVLITLSFWTFSKPRPKITEIRAEAPMLETQTPMDLPGSRSGSYQVPGQRPSKPSPGSTAEGAPPNLWTMVKGKFSPECRSHFDELQSMDGKEPVLLKSKCTGLTGAVADAQHAYYFVCGSYEKLVQERAPEEKQLRRKERCRAALFRYRIQSMEELTKEVPLDGISAPGILLEKLYVRMQSDGGGAGGAYEIAKKLLEIAPDSPRGAELLVSTSFMEMFHNPSSVNPDKLETLRSDIDQAILLGANSREIRAAELFFLISQGGDLGAFRSQVERFSSDYPQSGSGPYFLAWLEAKNGNRALTLQHLQRAVQIEPDFGRYQLLLVQVKASPPGTPLDTWFNSSRSSNAAGGRPLYSSYR